MASTVTVKHPSIMSEQQNFHSQFQHDVNALNGQIDRLADTALVGSARTEATDHCLAKLAKLSNEVKEASSSLPSYDQRSYTEAIRAVSSRLHEVRQASAPRAKFSFKSSRKSGNSAAPSTRTTRLTPDQPKNEPPTSSQKATDELTRGQSSEAARFEDQTGLTINSELSAEHMKGGQDPFHESSISQTTNVIISDLHNSYKLLPASASHLEGSGVLSRLKSCVVDISALSSEEKAFSGLSMKTIESSLLVCGHVGGPAHLTDLKRSVVVIACRQFRMHECHDCKVYLHCSSKPIIEGCSGIAMAPLPECYTTKDDASVKNQWNEIEDFNWLKTEANPHWTILPAEERVGESTWTELIPSGPVSRVMEMLHAVGVD